MISIRWVGDQRVTSWPKIRCQTSSSGKAMSEKAPQAAIMIAPTGASEAGHVGRGADRVARQRHAEDPGGHHAQQPDEDEVVGGVRQGPGIAAVVDVQRDVPVHAEHGDDQRTALDGQRERRPARQAGEPADTVGEASERRQAPHAIEPIGTMTSAAAAMPIAVARITSAISAPPAGGSA